MSRLNKYYFFTLLSFTFSCHRLSEGKSIYTSMCSNCHMEDGLGLAELVPAIKPTGFITNRKHLICLILKGKQDSTIKFGMPSFEKLNNAQVANVLNFLNTKQKFNGPFFNEIEIETARIECTNLSLK